MSLSPLELSIKVGCCSLGESLEHTCELLEGEGEEEREETIESSSL